MHSNEEGVMLENNKKIIGSIKRSLADGADPVASLANKFPGYTALVVSAGPSCVQWKKVYSRLCESEDKVILVAVKQALELLGDLCDFHFINTVNLKKYRSFDSCIVVYTKNASADPALCKRDVTFEIMERLDRDSFFLALTGNYGVYELKNTGPYRPPGPGIMHESVFFTLAHLGVSKIVTVGWDIADPGGMNSHYYDRRDSADHMVVSGAVKNIIARLGFLVFARKIRGVLNYFRYQMGGKINPSPMFFGEAEMVARSIPDLRCWLNKKGVALEIVSDSDWFRN